MPLEFYSFDFLSYLTIGLPISKCAFDKILIVLNQQSFSFRQIIFEQPKVCVIVAVVFSVSLFFIASEYSPVYFPIRQPKFFHLLEVILILVPHYLDEDLNLLGKSFLRLLERH